MAHSGVEIEEKALGLVIKVINFPKVDGVDPAVVFRLQVNISARDVIRDH